LLSQAQNPNETLGPQSIFNKNLQRLGNEGLTGMIINNN